MPHFKNGILKLLNSVYWECSEESELCRLIDWDNSPSLRGVTSWLETLCLHTVLLFTNRQSPALPVLNHNQRDAHGVYLRGYAHIPVRSWTETDREGSTALSVFSYYRDAQSFYSIGPIMAIHPLLLKSICFYLMPKQFPDALFFTPNTNHSVPLFLSPGWMAPCTFSPLPTEHVSCFPPLAVGSLDHRKFSFFFIFPILFLYFIFAWNKGKTFNSYWFGDI